MQVVMKTGAVRDVQSFNQIVTFKNPTPRFLQSGCSFCRPANSVIDTEWRNGIALYRPAHPKLTLDVPTLSLSVIVCSSYSCVDEVTAILQHKNFIVIITSINVTFLIVAAFRTERECDRRQTMIDHLLTRQKQLELTFENKDQRSIQRWALVTCPRWNCSFVALFCSRTA